MRQSPMRSVRIKSEGVCERLDQYAAGRSRSVNIEFCRSSPKSSWPPQNLFFLLLKGLGVCRTLEKSYNMCMGPISVLERLSPWWTGRVPCKTSVSWDIADHVSSAPETHGGPTVHESVQPPMADAFSALTSTTLFTQ